MFQAFVFVQQVAVAVVPVFALVVVVAVVVQQVVVAVVAAPQLVAVVVAQSVFAGRKPKKLQMLLLGPHTSSSFYPPRIKVYKHYT